MFRYLTPTRRAFQTRQLSTAASVINDWKSKLASHVEESHDSLVGSQLNLLANTLDDPLTEYKHDRIPPNGTPVPPAWHLVYFPPRFTEKELASDGYELNFKPPKPFVHRMWAGARLEWNRGNLLRIGQNATMNSKLADVQVNTGRRGESAFVWIDKDIHNEHGWSMRESRCLVYVQEPTEGGDRETPAKCIKGKSMLCPSAAVFYKLTLFHSEQGARILIQVQPYPNDSLSLFSFDIQLAFNTL